MESDLLEISQEDSDSLLLQNQKTQTDAVSTFDISFFSCSPLHLPISSSTDVKQKNPSSSSNINKENISNSHNKSELPKLSLDPQQMKRKKKGGCYNLRKSLAWDRAFFTEEGVLNSTELSLISGDFSKLSGEKLLSIEEEPGESGDAPGLQELESNLFKELPLNNSNIKEAKKTGISSLRQKSSGPASRSTVKQNALSVQDFNRSGSKRSGCPRPAVSSALKRPANVSTKKTAVKEPKISKIPAPKSESSTSRSSPNLNKPKRNPGAQAAVSAHRSIGFTGSNRSTRSTQNEAKISLSSKSLITKPSTTQPKRNVKSSSLARHSSAQSQHPLATKADNVLKVNRDPVVAFGHGSINHEAGSSKIVSIPQSFGQIGGSTRHADPQMAKPSGLRMPSPSLGFFAQSKVNAPYNIQSNSTECNTPKPNIPKLRKLGVKSSTFEIPTSSMKPHTVAEDVAATENTRMSSTGPSVPSSASSLCEDVRPNMRMSVRVPCNSYDHELINNQQQLHPIDSDLKQKGEDLKFQSIDNKLPLQSQSSGEVKLNCKREDITIPRSPDVSGKIKDPYLISHGGPQAKSALKADNAGNQLSGHIENNSLTEDFDLLPQLHSCDVNSCNIHGSPMGNNDQISIHDKHEHSSKEAELAKPCTFEDDQVSNEIERPHISDIALPKEDEPSEEFLSYISVQSKGIAPYTRDCNASEVESTNGLSHYGGKIQGNDGAVGAHDLNQQQKHLFECNLSLESSSDLLNALEADNQHTFVNEVNEKVVEQPPLSDPCIVADKISQENYGSHSTDCSLHGEIFSSEELIVESNLQHNKDVAYRRELSDSSAPCEIPPTLKNYVQEMDEVVEGQHVENEAPVSTNIQSGHDIELLHETTSYKGLERIREDEVTEAITACEIGVSNDCQSRGDQDARDLDDSHSVSPPGLVDDTIDLKKIEGSPYYFSKNHNSAISEPGENIISCHFDTSAMLTNSLMPKQSGCETIAQDVLIQSFEADNTFQETQIPEACHSLLSVEGNVFIESQNFELEMDVVVECRHVENEASGSTDTQCDHDIELLCEATLSKGLELIKEDQVTAAITAYDIGVSSDCQSSGDLDVREVDDSRSISPLGLAGDTIDLKNVEALLYKFSTKHNSAISEPGEKIIYRHFDEQSDCETTAQDVLIQSSFEAGNTFQEDQIPEACQGLFTKEGNIFAQSENFEPEMDKVVEFPHVENEASVSTDSQCDHDIERLCEATLSKGLELISEDRVTAAITAYDIGVSSDCQSSGDLDVREVDDSRSISPLGLAGDTIDLKNVEANPYNFSTKHNSAIAEPGEKIIYRHFDEQSDCETTAQDVLVQSSFEAGNTFQEDQIPEACQGLFTAEGNIFAQSEKFEPEMVKVVEFPHVENEASVSTDTQCDHDIELLCEATLSKGLELIREDRVTAAITAYDIGVSSDCQSSGDLDVREVDDSRSKSPLGLAGDTIDLKRVEDNPYYFYTKHNSAISEPGEKINSCPFNASAMLTNSLMAKQRDCETIEQDELIQSSLEAGNTFQENHIPEACHGHFSVEGNIFVESQTFHSDNCADVGPRDKSSVIQELEGSSGLSQVQTDKPNYKCAAGDDETTNGSLGEDACLLSSNGGISFDSCKTNLFTSAENNNFAVVENSKKPRELQNVITVMPERVKFGLSVTAETSSFVEIKLSDNNLDGCNDMIRLDNEQSGQVTALNGGLSSLSEDQVSGTGNTCKSQTFCSLTEESTSSINTNHISSNGSSFQEVNRLENDAPQELNSSTIPVEVKGSTSLVEDTGSDKKQVAPLVKPPVDAVPFSDEWLSAFEAAGEEILTMKSGAVQNSPKDKSLPEPSPWSPVKKKNNQTIGPFDCTKFTNTNVPPDSE